MAKKKLDIYEMKPLQVSLLRMAAMSESGIFANWEVKESDCPRERARLQFEWDMCQDLLELGLAVDVSNEEEEIIKKYEEKLGRRHRVLKITNAGQLMFDYCDDPECAVHKLGHPLRRYPC
jgi:hypothetical protein